MISTQLENAERCAQTCPIFHERSSLWFYGNLRLLGGKLARVQKAIDAPHPLPAELIAIESQAEDLVLGGHTLVVGVHNVSQMQASLVPLRWGSPRIVIFSGGFHYHLGPDLNQEPLQAGRLWRYQWDPITDLAISRRAPDKRPTFAHHNPTIDKLIIELTDGRRQDIGLLVAQKPPL